MQLKHNQGPASPLRRSTRPGRITGLGPGIVRSGRSDMMSRVKHSTSATRVASSTSIWAIRTHDLVYGKSGKDESIIRLL